MNVPIYVPPGHAIIYIVTYYFTRKAPIQQSKDKIELLFKFFIIVYSSAFLLLAKDIFGFCAITSYNLDTKKQTKRTTILLYYVHCCCIFRNYWNKLRVLEMAINSI